MSALQRVDLIPNVVSEDEVLQLIEMSSSRAEAQQKSPAENDLPAVGGSSA